MMYIYMYENRIIFLNFCKIEFEFINMEINLVFLFCFEFFRIFWLEIKYWYFYLYCIIKKFN